MQGGITMALIHVDYHSRCLSGITDLYACIPSDMPKELMGKTNPYYARPTKTLVLLHGYSGASGDWITGSPVRELSGKYNIAIICPNGHNSFYLDSPRSGNNYGELVGAEVLEQARALFHLSDRREDTFIGGFSMGGFGAIRNGIKYSENYSKIMALSSAMIVKTLKNIADPASPQRARANAAYYEDCFGDLSKAEETDVNPEWLIEKYQAEGKEIPEMYLACGTEDMLINSSREFTKFLTEHNVPYKWDEHTGIHNWTFWNSCIEDAIKWMVED